MSNKEKPYIPRRDPRGVNVVNRIKEIQDLERVFVDDEDVQGEDVGRTIKQTLGEGVGVPGGVVPLSDNGLIDPCYLPPSAGGSAVYTAATHEEFPAVGAEDMIYIATAENGGNGYIYRWCTIQNCYQRPDDDLRNVLEIYGGSAEDA